MNEQELEPVPRGLARLEGPLMVLAVFELGLMSADSRPDDSRQRAPGRFSAG